MKIIDLEKELRELNISQEIYSILKGGLPNEQLCLVKCENNWEVYYSERGRKSGLKIFTDEESACNYFFEKVKQML